MPPACSAEVDFVLACKALSLIAGKNVWYEDLKSSLIDGYRAHLKGCERCIERGRKCRGEG